MNDDEDIDPFACFELSDDDESDFETSAEGQHVFGQNDCKQQQRKRRQESKVELQRYAGNGVLAFHQGTEAALLNYVRTELQELNKMKSTRKVHCNRCSGKGDHDGECAAREIDTAQKVLDLVDSYCMSRHWMMHVGPDKATPLRKFIIDCLVEKEKTNGVHGNGNVVTIVELGTYCGYSSILIAKIVLDHLSFGKVINANGCPWTATDKSFSFHIYSVEVIEKFAAVAKELIRLAGMEDYISIILLKDQCGKEGSSLSSELKRVLPFSKDRIQGASNCMIDFLFVDHDKSLYLTHLRELEDARMIRKGTHVAADNVVFAEIHDYRHYMSDLAAKGIVVTRLEDSLFVEYCQPELIQAATHSEIIGGINKNDNENISSTETQTKDTFRDGIEFSVYLMNPP